MEASQGEDNCIYAAQARQSSTDIDGLVYVDLICTYCLAIDPINCASREDVTPLR